MIIIYYIMDLSEVLILILYFLTFLIMIHVISVLSNDFLLRNIELIKQA